jgi:hypothetical protein
MRLVTPCRSSLLPGSQFNRRSFGMKKSVLLMTAAVALCLAMAAGANADSAKGKSQTVKGWVSDSKCGVKGTSEAHAACAKKCLAAGEKPVIVSDKDQKILTVDNPDAVAGHEGHHVAVKGAVNGDSIHVDSLKMVAAKAGDKKGTAMNDMH